MKKKLSIIIIAIALLISSAVTTVAQSTRGIENTETIQPFMLELAKTRVGMRTVPVRIVQFGDSHTAADWLTGQIRKRFQRDFGRVGVSFEIRGKNGAEATSLLEMSDGQLGRALAPEVNSRGEAYGPPTPDLIILSYGTNEVTSKVTKRGYKQIYIEILARLRRFAPNASILVYGPPDRALQSQNGWESSPRLPYLIEAQREAAYESGAAFWSSYGAMGGAGSINTWVAYGLGQGDHAHLTQNGYIRCANLFYNDFVTVFNAFNPYEMLAGQPVQKNSGSQGRNLTRSVSF